MKTTLIAFLFIANFAVAQQKEAQDRLMKTYVMEICDSVNKKDPNNIKSMKQLNAILKSITVSVFSNHMDEIQKKFIPDSSDSNAIKFGETLMSLTINTCPSLKMLLDKMENVKDLFKLVYATEICDSLSKKDLSGVHHSDQVKSIVTPIVLSVFSSHLDQLQLIFDLDVSDESKMRNLGGEVLLKVKNICPSFKKLIEEVSIPKAG